jgi:hypothetical protein
MAGFVTHARRFEEGLRVTVSLESQMRGSLILIPEDFTIQDGISQGEVFKGDSMII